MKTNKNDASDAEAICEALIRPTMRFAPVKSAEQQSVLMLHRARELLVHGARTVLLWSRRKRQGRSPWQEALLARRPTNVVLVAMANKAARVVWAMLSRGETFRVQVPAAA